MGTFGEMLCVCCGVARAGRGTCCHGCRLELVPGGELWLAGGLIVHAAFRHDGSARRLVHRLKYEAFPAAALPLAAAMAPGACHGSVLVPVPRVIARHWKHGIDPARELAAAVSRLTGIPVLGALVPGWWHAARAGPGGKHRGEPRFRAIRAVPGRWVLIDDVLTTGTTLRAASQALEGTGRAVVATVAQAGPGRRR